MTFPEKLQRLLQDMSRAAVARRAGIHPITLGEYVHGRCVPGTANAVKLAKALGVDVGWLISDDREFPPVRIEVPCPPSVHQTAAA